MNTRVSSPTKLAAVFLTVLAAAWLSAEAVLNGTTTSLLVPLAVAAGGFVLFATLMDWRRGVLLFLTWMLFEDLVRKYMGNNMAVYFAKDVLVAACCLSFFIARRRERNFGFRLKLPFLFPLVCFFFWALLETFNPNSVSIWYGLLGLKLYFGYVPLLFLGYALLRDESDLRRFLLINVALAALIALVGILQGLTGTNLLTPAELAPDIRLLGGLMRYAPITGERFLRPPSVFVSDGRFGAYLLLAWLLGFGATMYSFIRRLPGRRWLPVALGLVTTAIILSAVRGTLVWVAISGAVFLRAYAREFWNLGARRRRIVTAVMAVGILVVGAFFFMSAFYPEALGARMAFYQQTLLPSSPTYELTNRVWDYPVSEFRKAFADPNWLWGYGTGTSSLGAQYLTRIMGVPAMGIGVESGFGNLVLEMGLPGLLLWLGWTASLIYAQWKVVRQLRGTTLFPIGFTILWFSFLTLLPAMVSGPAIENYVTAAYLFLLSGVLFSLPELAKSQKAAEAAPSRLQANRAAPRVYVGTAPSIG